MSHSPLESQVKVENDTSDSDTDDLGGSSSIRLLTSFGFFPKANELANTPLKIDKVNSDLVGKCRVLALLKEISPSGPKWASTILEMFECKDFAHWCGRRGTDAKPKVLETRHTFKDAVMALDDGVLVNIDKASLGKSDSLRSYVTILLVPKGNDSARVIVNCKELNKQFSKGPSLSLASQEDLFRIVTLFAQRAFFATANFSHWFYQLPVPKGAQPFFSIKCENLRRQFSVWPRGFSWSPFVAQGISMLLAWRAIRKCHLNAVSPMSNDDTIPPFWIITQVTTGVQKVDKPQRGEIKGFVLFCYDNLLVVCNSERLRSRILDSLMKTTQNFHAVWNSESLGVEALDGSVFSLSEDSVDFLGIRYEKQDRKWMWNHLPKTTERWIARARSLSQSLSLTYEDLCFLSEVLIWDWSVAGREKEALGVALEISFKIADDRRRFGTSQSSWKMPLSDQAQWDPLVKGAISKLLELAKGGPHVRQLSVVHPFEHTWFLCSDACNNKGAWLNLVTKVGEAANFSTVDQEKHIHWKDTWWALRALEVSIAECPPRTLVKIGVDNMASVCALKHKVVGFDRSLHNKMTEVAKLYETKGCLWLAHHIAGDVQPTDDLSRGHKVNEEKVQFTKKFLESRPDTWFHWSPKATKESLGSKRERSIDRDELQQETS